MRHYDRIQDARRRRANPQPAPPPVEEQLYPDGLSQTDVLFVVGQSPSPGWWETRGRLCVDLLLERDLSAACVTLQGEGRLRALIEELRPRIVVNRALLISPEITERLAQDYPRVQFVAVNHSSHSFLIASPNEWRSHWGGFWRLAETRDNCYLASPDERNHLAEIRPDLAGKLLWVPNPSRLPDWQARALGEPPQVSLICAGRALKNIPNQLLAYALAFQRQEMRLLISCRGYDEKLRLMCDALRIEAEFHPWLDWPDYIDRLRSIDVCLQASFTESFNYVGLEHLLCGVPVVGTEALRFLPARWQVDGDSPSQIAACLLDRVSNWPVESERARAIGLEFAERRNGQFQSTFAGLL